MVEVYTALRGAGAVSNRKSARVTEAPPPKSLEVEPGNEASLVSMIFWMM